MAVQSTKEKQVDLKFENGDKENGKLLMVKVVSPEWEKQRYRIWFHKVNGNVCVCTDSSHRPQPIGEIVSAEEPYFPPPRCFKPAIKQARALFNKYCRPNEEKPKYKAPQVGRKARSF